MQSSGKEVAQVPVVPTSCFDGWYFGIHGGGLLTNFNSRTSAFGSTESARGNVDTAFDFSTRGNDGGAEGGLQVGYNFQRGGWIFGLEVEISAAAFERINSAQAVIPLDQESGGPFSYKTGIGSKTDLNWYSTVRPRFGHTLGERVYLFGTGGLAVGSAEVSEVTGVSAGTPGGTTSGSDFQGNRDVSVGWTAGAGIDFCLTQHVILNFTYLYVDLGDASASSTFSGEIPTNDSKSSGFRTFDSQTHASSDLKFHVFQGGVSFKF